jgi:hypothetical protein
MNRTNVDSETNPRFNGRAMLGAALAASSASRDAVTQPRRESLDAEIGRILTEDTAENLAILGEFAHTTNDGLDGEE